MLIEAIAFLEIQARGENVDAEATLTASKQSDEENGDMTLLIAPPQDGDRATKARRWRHMIEVGYAWWVVGGGAPLNVPPSSSGRSTCGSR